VRALSFLTFKFILRAPLSGVPDPTDVRRADELASLAVKIDPDYHIAHTAKGDALSAAGRYREWIDSYQRALMLAPSSIQVGLPVAHTFIGEPENAIAYADKAMQLSPRTPGVWPGLYFAKAIAFGQLQDYEQALVWIERADASVPESPFAGLVRSVLL